METDLGDTGAEYCADSRVSLIGMGSLRMLPEFQQLVWVARGLVETNQSYWARSVHKVLIGWCRIIKMSTFVEILSCGFCRQPSVFEGSKRLIACEMSKQEPKELQLGFANDLHAL